MGLGGHPSEGNFSAELQDASGTRGNHTAEISIVRIIADRCADIGGGEWVVAILRVIEYVEGFHAELKRHAFRESEILSQTHIPVIDAWAPNDVSSAVSKLTSERLGEARGIKPLLQAFSAAWAAPRHLIGALSERGEQSEFVVGQHREGEPFLECRDGCDLPPSQGEIGSFVYIAAKFLPPPKGQLVDQAGNETVVDVEVREAMIEARVVLVHVPGERVGSTDTRCR